MIDIKAIKQAAIDSDETGFASVLTNNDTVIALCDEIERLRADSARYQWLREQNADEPGKLGVFRYEQMGTCVSEFEPVWVGADLDAVVDAAMEAK